MTESRRAGFVAVIGAPNAGKSTLVNALVGQKVAIVSPKAQTTRARLMGIAIHGEAQILLVDTPGIFAPRRRLDRAMVAAAWTGAEDADLIILVIDASEAEKSSIDRIAARLENRQHPLFLVLNKIDLVNKPDLLAVSADLTARLDPRKVLMISATMGAGTRLFSLTVPLRPGSFMAAWIGERSPQSRGHRNRPAIQAVPRPNAK